MGQTWVYSYYILGLYIGQWYELVVIGMPVFTHGFEWVDAHFYCGFTKSDDGPLFIILIWKGVRNFYQGEKCNITGFKIL